MYVVHVYIHVKPESVEAFRQASIANARGSLQEPGVVRFDVLQQEDDPTRFTLVEIYRTPQDPALHRETGHYKVWSQTVADMMAEPRTRTVYSNVFPSDAEWR